MTNLRETQTSQPWADDGLEPTWDTDLNNDDLLLDDFSDDNFSADNFSDDTFSDDEIAAESDQVDKLSNLPTWRLIEIARENKYLKTELADFDQYDEDEYFGKGLSSGYSH